jgi:hypothetical protein
LNTSQLDKNRLLTGRRAKNMENMKISYHEFSQHGNGLDRKLATTHIEHIFQTGAQ